MITIDEIKEALGQISETEIIDNLEHKKNNRIMFKKRGDGFAINILPENAASKTNLRLSRLFGISKKTTISKEECESIAEYVNLQSNTPCKVIHVRNITGSGLDNHFFITNTHADKLDQFKKFANEKIKISSISALILGMMLEIILCFQEITIKIDEEKDKSTEEGDGGDENGK